MPGSPHQSDEQLELYALGRLPEPLLAAVEEHLLICVACQQRLDDVEAFALAMRQAIAERPSIQRHPSWFARIWPGQTLVWAAGFVLLVLATVAWHLQTSRKPAPLASLQLSAMRGEMPLTGLATETALTLTDIQAGFVLRVEVADAGGGTVWSETLPENDRTVKIARQLAPGSYFVRVHDSSGQLLHEYGFRVQ